MWEGSVLKIHIITSVGSVIIARYTLHTISLINGALIFLRNG